MNRNGRALTRERRPAKRNLHLASAQVNGRAVLSMMRSLAGEGFRLGPNLRDFFGMAVRSGGAGRFRDSVSPNGMELPLSLARRLSMMRHVVNVRGVVDAVINDKRTSIPFCQKTDALTRKSEMNRNGRALTRERRPAKRNLHLASAQVNGRAVLSMMRSLAGEGFRLGPNLRDFFGMAVRSGGAGRFRDSVSPNGMELPLSLARRLSMMRHVVNVRGVVDAVINDKRTSIPFCQKTDAVTRKSVTNRKGRALTRERRRAKRNLHLASVQVNGRAALTMMRSLAGEGFRLERLPLRVTAHCVCCCALLRVRGAVVVQTEWSCRFRWRVGCR